LAHEGIDARGDQACESTQREMRQGDDKFSQFYRKTKQELKPKPAPESPRPGAADCSGKTIKSALAGLGAEFILRVFQKFCGGNSFECAICVVSFS
jgi:hypothetical protein